MKKTEEWLKETKKLGADGVMFCEGCKVVVALDIRDRPHNALLIRTGVVRHKTPRTEFNIAHEIKTYIPRTDETINGVVFRERRVN